MPSVTHPTPRTNLLYRSIYFLCVEDMINKKNFLNHYNKGGGVNIFQSPPPEHAQCYPDPHPPKCKLMRKNYKKKILMGWRYVLAASRIVSGVSPGRMCLSLKDHFLFKKYTFIIFLLGIFLLVKLVYIYFQLVEMKKSILINVL